MQSRSCKAYAKINLMLDVIGVRDDGYHSISTVMHSVSLCDTVTIKKSCNSGICVQTNLPYVPTDSRNIAYKAAELFYKIAKLPSHVIIELHKRIPVGAGMAGGSANAAAVLRLLNAAHCNVFSMEELAKMGLQLGADVPFCVFGTPSIATGIGEVLQPAPSLPPCYILICKPRFSTSTQKLYAKTDEIASKIHPDSTKMIDALEQQNLAQICQSLGNSMEAAAIHLRPTIADIKRKLLALGAGGALMTGSGSAVYGIFDSFEVAQKAKAKFKSDIFTYIAKPVKNYFGEIVGE